MNWANESPYGQAVYDTLLQASPSGTIQPDLATAWSYNADKTVLTLTLRTGVPVAAGEPVGEQFELGGSQCRLVEEGHARIVVRQG